MADIVGNLARLKGGMGHCIDWQGRGCLVGGRFRGLQHMHRLGAWVLTLNSN